MSVDSAGGLRRCREAFRQALAATPALDREMHQVPPESDLLELEMSLAFQQEYAAASSPASGAGGAGEICVAALSGQQSASKIELQFAASGR